MGHSAGGATGACFSCIGHSTGGDLIVMGDSEWWFGGSVEASSMLPLSPLMAKEVRDVAVF